MNNRNRLLAATLLSVVFLIVSLNLGAQNQKQQPKTHQHEITGETCYICDATLRDKGRMWCKEHARYEDRCWICHPDLEDKDRAFCTEHSLYEDECFICNPQLLTKETHDSEGKGLAGSCLGHGIQKDLCYICDPQLREKGRLWCKEHDRYEDRCWKCHPELKDKTRPFCAEHSLYEDECFICSPELNKKPASKDGKKAARATIQCNEHRVPEEECGICQPQLASSFEVGRGMKVRFESKASASKAGIMTGRPGKTSSVPMVETFCQLNYNENAVVLLTPVLSGIVQRVLVDLGQDVKAGQLLAELHSIDVSKAKTEYLSAIADVRLTNEAYLREKTLVDQKISATREYQEAFAAYEKALFARNTAYQRLLNYGFDEGAIVNISEKRDRSSTLQIRAPFRGTIVAREAVMGEAIEPGRPLLTVADLSTMWLELKIPSDQAASVRTGLSVEASFQSLPEFSAQGVVIWVDSAIDPSSRMMKARAVIDNDGQLKKGMFGLARIAMNDASSAYHISKDAIQRHEDKSFVFLRLEDDLYEFRRVTLGNLNGKSVDIVAGIEPNDDIVIAGTFTVMSEFLKSRLGAGCVDD